MINLKEKLSFSAVNINNNTLSDRKSSRFKPSINIIAVLISAAVFLLLSRSTYAFGIKIAAQESAAGEYISLGDIAEISNFSYSQQKLAELKELQLKRAPQAGYGKNITRVLVDLSVKSLGYSEDDYYLDMPKTIKVERESQLVDADQIKNYLEKYIRENLNYSNLVIDYKGEINDLKISAGEYKLTTAPNFNLNFGNNSIPVQIKSNEKILKRLYYSIKIGVKSRVLSAADDIAYGSIIQKANFKLEERKIFSNPADYFEEWNQNQLTNRVLKRSLKKGDLLEKEDIKKALLVSWGDKLRINVNVNNVSITTFVTARGRGGAGDIITVENESSGYEFQAEIISKSKAKMLSK